MGLIALMDSSKKIEMLVMGDGSYKASCCRHDLNITLDAPCMQKSNDF